MDKFTIQEQQYVFPYHHLIDFPEYLNYKSLHWGIEYFCYIEKVKEMINREEYNTILDVGCGDGKLICELSSESAQKKYTGCDLAKQPILFANAFSYDRENVHFINDSVQSINEKFDIVTLVETLEHISDDMIKEFVEQVIERVENGGSLIISVPTINKKLNKKHYRHYDLNLLQKQLSHTPNISLVDHFFVAKIGILMQLTQKISNKFSAFRFVKKITNVVINKFLKNAKASNGSHLVAVFKKN